VEQEKASLEKKKDVEVASLKHQLASEQVRMERGREGGRERERERERGGREREGEGVSFPDLQTWEQGWDGAGL